MLRLILLTPCVLAYRGLFLTPNTKQDRGEEWLYQKHTNNTCKWVPNVNEIPQNRQEDGGLIDDLMSGSLLQFNGQLFELVETESGLSNNLSYPVTVSEVPFRGLTHRRPFTFKQIRRGEVDFGTTYPFDVIAMTDLFPFSTFVPRNLCLIYHVL